MKKISNQFSATLSFCSLCLYLLFCGCTTSDQRNDSLKIAIAEDPHSLDPRLVRALPDVTILKMLYEGLMRTNSHGINEPAAASSVTVSEDQRTYTFTLRNSLWSDGTPVTAQDFEETWKSLLAPTFPAPNAYQLFLIKGAKAAKEGKAPLADVGIRAINPETLVVELEQPTPYFLEMTTCHFYFPVSSSTRAASAGTAKDQMIGNGPFQLESWKRRSELTVAKNPHYWDSPAVSTNKITLAVLDETTALHLFAAGSLDWVGSPISTLPQDAIAPLKQRGLLKVLPGTGTHWFRLNTQSAPFENEMIRRAFAMALDRQSIVEHVTQGNQQPAIGIIPPAFDFADQNYYKDHDLEKANALLVQGLNESGRTKADISPVVLSYVANDRNSKIAQAVQQQWSKGLGIEIKLEANEGPSLMAKMKSGTYQASLGSWFADFRDPFNYLEIFANKDNPTNQTYWQSDAYTALLNHSSTEMDPAIRKQTLEKAEAILMQGMPVVPIFYSAYNFLTSERIKDVYFSPLGFLDFKNAKIVPQADTRSIKTHTQAQP